LRYLASIQDITKINAKTKEDFQNLSSLIIEHIIKQHQSKPLYHQFVETHIRELAQPLKDVEVRKAASALTTLANEKQKEAKDKASGKKKAKPATKSTLGAAKVVGKYVLTTLIELQRSDRRTLGLIQGHMRRLWTTLMMVNSCRLATGHLNFNELPSFYITVCC
jgi:Translation initiation factor eIF3 subunit